MSARSDEFGPAVTGADGGVAAYAEVNTGALPPGSGVPPPLAPPPRDPVVENAVDAVVIDERMRARGASYFSLVRRKFAKSVSGMVGLVLVTLLILMAVFADFLAPYDPKANFEGFSPPTRITWHTEAHGWSLRPHAIPIRETGELDPVTFQPIVGPDTENPVPIRFFVEGARYRLLGLIPARTRLFGTPEGEASVHVLGTDKFGRDLLSRAFVGSRLTLTIALIVVTITTVIGTFLGIVSGYVGGRFDNWFQRVVELFLAFPELPLYLALASIIPLTVPSKVFIVFVILILAALRWARLSREVRGKTLSLRQLDYVRAAESVGASNGRIIGRHILPNVMSHVIVAVTLLIPEVVLLESFLGFLGFAVKPPLISWGLMLQDTSNFSTLGSYPWILAPVGFVLVTVFAFNAFGDGLRDAIDPY